MRALALPILLAGCQQAELPSNAVEPVKARAVDTDVTAAQRMVRERLGTTGEITFGEATRSASEGVRIVCGAFRQGEARHRYIVVGDVQAFIEPQMAAGEMDTAYAEFCREGRDNTPGTRLPAVENRQ